MRVPKKMMMMLGGFVPWYLAGGVAKANCLAAYQAKGAASLAASFINLVTPGTYDLAAGVDPTWAAATGWTFNGSTQMKSTGITPGNGATQTWSLIFRFANTSVGVAEDAGIGCDQGDGNRFSISPSRAGIARKYQNGTNYNQINPGDIIEGIMAIAGANCYLDGAPDGTLVPTSANYTVQIWIGGNPISKFTGNIQAAAIYNVVISAVQVAAISAAMAAL